MQDKTSKRNMFCLLAIILISTVPVTDLPVKLGQDIWISLLLSIIPVIPLLVIYSRLTALMPEKDIFQITQEIFGKIGAGIAGFLFSFYFIFMAGFVIYNFTELIHLTALFKTPVIIIMIILLLAALYLANSGIEAMSKWAYIMFTVMVITIIGTGIASLNAMDMGNLLPVAENSFKDIIKGSYSLVSYPFGEAMIILIIFASLKKENLKPFKISIFSTLMSLLLILILIIRAITVLGPELTDTSLFAVYKATSVAKAGNYLQRIGAFIEFVYILAGMIKIGVYLFAGFRAVSSFIVLKNKKIILFSVGVLAVAVSFILFNNNLYIVDFYKIFALSAIPFQIIIPVFLWICAEIKVRR